MKDTFGALRLTHKSTTLENKAIDKKASLNASAHGE